MRLSKIRISRAPASLVLLLLGCISLLPSRLAAQSCSGGAGSIQSSTQTVTLVGNGGNYFAPVFSQYNPPTGYVLVSAVLQTQFTIFGSASIKNTSGATQVAIVGAADDDEVTLNGSTFSNSAGQISAQESNFSNFAPVVVPNNSTVTAGPQTLFTNQTLEDDSLTTAQSTLNDFIGTGSPNIGYYNYVFQQQNPSNVSVTTSLTVDITFNLTYYYCNTQTLAVNLLNFTAKLENPQTALLNWTTTGETPGEKYVVQVSSGNGTDFVNADTVLANGAGGDGSYAYEYAIPPADKGSLYFRIELIDPSGTVSYSPLRVVNLGDGTNPAFSIYPNPAINFINLTFPGNSQNWEVQIFAANGDLIQQNYFPSTNLATVNFNHKMAAGAYFVRAVNPQNSDHYTGSFIIKD